MHSIQFKSKPETPLKNPDKIPTMRHALSLSLTRFQQIKHYIIPNIHMHGLPLPLIIPTCTCKHTLNNSFFYFSQCSQVNKLHGESKQLVVRFV